MKHLLGMIMEKNTAVIIPSRVELFWENAAIFPV